MSEDRLTRIETIVEYHEKMIIQLQDTTKHLNHELGELRTSISRIEQKLNDTVKEVRELNRRYLYYIALIFTAINIVISTTLALIK